MQFKDSMKYIVLLAAMFAAFPLSCLKDNNTVLTKQNLLDSVGTTNLALNKPVTVTGTVCTTSESGDKAVNGSTSDRWCATSSKPTLKVDLGSILPITQIVVKHAGVNGESSVLNTRDFNLQVSVDGSTYSTVATITGNTANVSTHTLTATSYGRYVRLSIVKPTNSTDSTTRIYEFEVYGIAANCNNSGAGGSISGAGGSISGAGGAVAGTGGSIAGAGVGGSIAGTGGSVASAGVGGNIAGAGGSVAGASYGGATAYIRQTQEYVAGNDNPAVSDLTFNVLPGSTILVFVSDLNFNGNPIGSGTPYPITVNDGVTNYTELFYLNDPIDWDVTKTFVRTNVSAGNLTVHTSWITNQWHAVLVAEIAAAGPTPIINFAGLTNPSAPLTTDAVTSGTIALGTNPALIIGFSVNYRDVDVDIGAPYAGTGFTAYGTFWNWNGKEGTSLNTTALLESEYLVNPGTRAAIFTAGPTDFYHDNLNAIIVSFQ